MRTRMLIGLFSIALIAGACGNDEGTSGEPAGGTTAAQPGEGLSIAFVYDGALDDGGWNESHDRGRQYMVDNLPGVETVTVEEIAPGDQAQATFEDLATQGYDLVVGTTFMQDDALAVAPNFPDTKFITWGGWETADNVGAYSLATEEGRYLDGLVAGSMTESNIIGYSGGFAIEEVNRGINAFARGVQEVNPDARIVVVYTNNWYDPPKERQAAQSLVDAGADVLVHELNSPATASVAEKNGVYLIGYGFDQSSYAPESWLGTFTFDWGPYYLAQAQAIVDGTWEGSVYYAGIADGGIGTAPFGDAVPQDVIDLVEQRKQEITDGTLDVMAGPMTDNEGNVQVAEGDTIPFEERTACCLWLLAGVEGSVEG